MPIRAAIIDDEPIARQRVRRLLEQEADVEIVGEAGDGIEAVALIRDVQPDLVFLDVQMPGKDGFAVLEEIPATSAPVVIFLTAYDRYAVRAFEAEALDYLLKPFEEARFSRAVARARAQIAAVDGANATAEASAADSPAPYLERLIIKAGGRVLFRRASEIDWVEAYGNYVRLHTGGAAYLLRETISNLERRLDPQRFARVHRSALVQIDRIKQIEPMVSGQHRLILRDGTALTLSRRYRRRLPRALLRGG